MLDTALVISSFPLISFWSTDWMWQWKCQRDNIKYRIAQLHNRTEFITRSKGPLLCHKFRSYLSSKGNTWGVMVITEPTLREADESSDLRLADNISWVLAATAIGGRLFLAGESHKSGGQKGCLQSLSYIKCKHLTAQSMRNPLWWLLTWDRPLYTRVFSIDAILRCCSNLNGT